METIINYTPKYKLLDHLISQYKLSEMESYELSRNPSDGAIEYLAMNRSYIDWMCLSSNPNDKAIDLISNTLNHTPTAVRWMNWDAISARTDKKSIELLCRYSEMIWYPTLSGNPNDTAVDLLLKYIENDGPKIDHSNLSSNTNDRIIDWLSKNLDYIDYSTLPANPNDKAVELSLEYLEKDLHKFEDDEAWDALSRNPNNKAVDYLLTHINTLDRHQCINSCEISQNTNPRITEWLIKHKNYIDWSVVSGRKDNEAMILLMDHASFDDIDWDELSKNPNDKAVDILLQSLESGKPGDSEIYCIYENTNMRLQPYIRQFKKCTIMEMFASSPLIFEESTCDIYD